MGIKGFFKWLKNTYPECLIRNIKLCSKCNTFFIDFCQLTFRSKELTDRAKISPDKKMDFFLSNLISRVNNTILKINPTDTIYIFEDGPNPAIKFQRQRERWFKKEHIDNYVIDPTEYKLSDMLDQDELIIRKLEEYFERITHNCKYLRAKRILYSTTYAPGEAEHKYFDVFRNFKNKQSWRPNQTHSIFTTDNDLIFLALQFFDEHFFIVRDFETIIDISILRDLLLYELFQSPNLYQKENRLKAAHEFVSQIPINLQQHVINDIIALSFIIGNDYLPPIPDFSNSFSFSNLLNSYKKVNEIFFSKIISKSQNETDDASFIQLIVNDSICVSSLQKIIQECFHKPSKNKNTNSDQKPNLEDKNVIKIDIKESNDKNEAENNNDNDSENNNIIENNENDIEEYDDKNDTDNINDNDSENNNIIENNENDIKKSDEKNDGENNNDSDSENNNIIENNENDIKIDIKESDEKNDGENSNDNIKNDNENDENYINENGIKNSEDNEKDYSNSSNTNIEKLTNNNQTSNDDDIEEKSQHMLRVFNFTWLYYTKGCPSWSYYYPFKCSPKLRTAINFMKQEGPEVFQTAGYNEKTEPMFKIFVLHPVERKESIPWCLYKLKIPPSEISHFWPLGAKNVNDIPVFDLGIMKKYYKEARKQIKQEEMKYNRCDPLYKTYKNMNKHNYKKSKTKCKILKK